MRILIEEYPYKADEVRNVLAGLSPLENVKGEVSVSYVGYFFNTQLNDCVFILPKVLVNEDGYLFDREGLKPDDIIDFDRKDVDDKLLPGERDFIYEFAVWIYRAIAVYNQKPNDIVYEKKILESGKGSRRKRKGTLLDIIITMLHFHRENQAFFMRILRDIHSGYNKVHWTKTINRTTAVVNQNVPVYTNPVNRKSQINFDEELMVIFFSILNHIHERYGFPVNIQLGYDLIRGKQFDRYLHGYGQRRLRQIKYKYFSDKALRIWELCYDFFERSSESVTASIKEYLLAKNFNIVFEAIIDELIGDTNVPDELKNQRDGKIVDHIFSYRGLTTHEEDKDIYYIGDSKYYKLGNHPGDASVYKQYTYARNLIQWNLDLFMPDDDLSQEKRSRRHQLRENHDKYRDEVTEGYNVIPNFFISAKLTDGIKYVDHLEPHRYDGKEDSVRIQRQFENRLFDRDTLLISHYDVNFLYIVSLYARNRATEKAAWKRKVQAEFRRQIQSLLSQHFTFYVMQAKPGVDAEGYFEKHFRDSLGKVYSPYQDTSIYSLALDQDQRYKDENETIINKLSQFFYVVECPLGENPQERISEAASVETLSTLPPDVDDGLFFLATPTREVNPDKEPFVNGTATEFITGRALLNEAFSSFGIKYFIPVVDHVMRGYYDVKGMGMVMFEDLVPPYRLKFELGAYHPFPNGPAIFGLDRIANKGQAFTRAQIEKRLTDERLIIRDKL